MTGIVRFESSDFTDVAGPDRYCLAKPLIITSHATVLEQFVKHEEEIFDKSILTSTIRSVVIANK
ncbi:hypothetical protein L484_005739 [Morus notabilis]|uniref:Uncharacterized protein n=1 Tax=Morus notabilis TaxID=981085 RepID=W9QBQ0_9ROSA|nr:hypothetical protein L484_005739 [Morus notabilis]